MTAIKLNCRYDETREFISWLKKNGQDAWVSGCTICVLNPTKTDEELWDLYCEETEEATT